MYLPLYLVIQDLHSAAPAPVPDCIIPQLFGVEVVETCAIITGADPRPWIGNFIKIFETATRGIYIVRSVTLLHKRYCKVSPLRLDVEPLGQARRSGVPTPHSAFIKEWYRKQSSYGSVTTESTVAELFEFENAKSAKKLDVFVWTVKQVDRRGRNSLQYAFLLQVTDT